MTGKGFFAWGLWCRLAALGDVFLPVAVSHHRKQHFRRPPWWIHALLFWHVINIAHHNTLLSCRILIAPFVLSNQSLTCPACDIGIFPFCPVLIQSLASYFYCVYYSKQKFCKVKLNMHFLLGTDDCIAYGGKPLFLLSDLHGIPKKRKWALKKHRKSCFLHATLLMLSCMGNNYNLLLLPTTSENIKI